MHKKLVAFTGVGGTFAAAGIAAALLIPTASSTASGGAASAAAPASPNGLKIAALAKSGTLPAVDELQQTAKVLGLPANAFREVGSAWVAERPGEVCAVAVKHGGGCWKADAAKTGNLAFEFRTADNVVTRTGIVTDGYSRAVARDVNGVELDAAPIVDNMYSVTGKDLRSIEISGPGGLPTLTVDVVK